MDVNINQVVFIVISGYIFLITLHLTRYYHQTISGNKLLYNSIIAGSFVALVLFFIREFLIHLFPIVINFLWHKIPLGLEIKSSDSYLMLGRSFMCMPFAFLLARLINFLMTWNYSFCNYKISASKIKRYITLKFGDDFEKLYWQLDEEEEYKDKFVLITLKNNKVYVGWFRELDMPIRNVIFSIYPVLSGFRNSETKLLTFTTMYSYLYERYANNEAELDEIKRLMEIRVLKSEIITMNRFDFNLYNDFQSQLDDLEEEQKISK